MFEKFFNLLHLWESRTADGRTIGSDIYCDSIDPVRHYTTLPLKEKIIRFKFPTNSLIILTTTILFFYGLIKGSYPMCSIGISLFIIKYIGSYKSWKELSSIEINKITIPDLIQEYSSFKVHIAVKNTSNKNIHNLMLRIAFTGSKRKHFDTLIPLLAPKRTFSHVVNFKCDMGMGLFKLGPISIFNRDPINIFPKSISSQYVKSVEVKPEIILINKVNANSPNPDSYTGDIDTEIIGRTGTFAGLRQWHQGDQQKNIHWKHTAKSDKLIVKEFDSLVQASANIFFDKNALGHSKLEDTNSFEKLKDASIAIIRQLKKQNIPANLFTQNQTFNIDMDIDSSEMIDEISKYTKNVNSTSITTIINNNLINIAPYSLVFIFTTTTTLDTDELLESLLKFDDNKNELIIIIIDSMNFSKYINKKANIKHSDNSLEELNINTFNDSKSKKFLNQIEARTYLLSATKSINEVYDSESGI